MKYIFFTFSFGSQYVQHHSLVMDDDGSADDTMVIDDEFTNSENINVSSLIHIGSFVSQWEQVLDTVDYLPNTVSPDRVDLMCELLGSNQQIVSELEEVCNPDLLKAQVSEAKPVDKLELQEVMPASRSQRLNTLQFRLDCLTDPSVKVMHAVSTSRGKFRANRFSWNIENSHLADSESKKHQGKQISEPVTILEITTFKPHLISGIDRDSKVKIMYDRELLALSTLQLKDIKSVMPCLTDETLFAEECSEYPDIGEDVRVKDMFKSSYYFIENVFYVDNSDEKCRDLSESVRKWASEHEGRPGVSSDMQVKPLEGVMLQDLSVRLGYPYLYCHAGDCEHVFMFSDLRLMHNSDDKNLANYPKLTNKCASRRAMCCVCSIYTASWLTRENQFAPCDPAFFCDKCFRMLHYDKDGRKLGTFKAWPHTDNAVHT